MDFGDFMVLSFFMGVSYILVKLFARSHQNLDELDKLTKLRRMHLPKTHLNDDTGLILGVLLEDKIKKEKRKMHKQEQIKIKQQKKAKKELHELIFEEEMVKFNYLFAETKKREEAQKVVEAEMLLAEEQRKLEEIENAKKAHDLELQNLAKNLGELEEARMKELASQYKKRLEQEKKEKEEEQKALQNEQNAHRLLLDNLAKNLEEIEKMNQQKLLLEAEKIQILLDKEDVDKKLQEEKEAISNAKKQSKIDKMNLMINDQVNLLFNQYKQQQF